MLLRNEYEKVTGKKAPMEMDLLEITCVLKHIYNFDGYKFLENNFSGLSMLEKIALLEMFGPSVQLIQEHSKEFDHIVWKFIVGSGAQIPMDVLRSNWDYLHEEFGYFLKLYQKKLPHYIA